VGAAVLDALVEVVLVEVVFVDVVFVEVVLEVVIFCVDDFTGVVVAKAVVLAFVVEDTRDGVVDAMIVEEEVGVDEAEVEVKVVIAVDVVLEVVLVDAFNFEEDTGEVAVMGAGFDTELRPKLFRKLSHLLVGKLGKCKAEESRDDGEDSVLDVVGSLVQLAVYRVACTCERIGADFVC
jgi:hypothetical protein